MDNLNGKNNIFTTEEINNISKFYYALKKVHNRLIQEGYIIEEGNITPPSKKLDIKQI